MGRLPIKAGGSRCLLYHWLLVTVSAAILCGTLWTVSNPGRSTLYRVCGTAAAANDKAHEVINRFHYTMEHVNALKDIGKNEMHPMTSCSEKFALGSRTATSQKVPEFTGNACEPWMARYAIVFLDRLLDREMRGLEWSSGSSTMWLLVRLRSLISIEHSSGWVQSVSQHLEKIFPSKYFQSWTSHVVAAETFEATNDEENYRKFKVYVDADFLPRDTAFDFISIDGRARIHCLKRALPILKPEGGVLMLDNSNREAYAIGYQAVPTHWLKFEDSINSGERTTLWVSCLPGKCGGSTTFNNMS